VPRCARLKLKHRLACGLARLLQQSIGRTMVKQVRNVKALLADMPVLITESKDEFEAVYKDVDRQVKPRDIIEEFEVSHISSLIWDILRLRKSKVGIINAGFRAAMEQIFKQLLRKPGETRYVEPSEDAQVLAWKWFVDPKAKANASELLTRFGLDESAIEATVIRNTLPEIETVDRLIALAEARLRQALRFIAEYRESLARQLREAADRILADEKVLRLEDASSETSVVP
jgi:hypothetical protein